jgi:RimJ/RimL family protein N-acetyltransferase
MGDILTLWENPCMEFELQPTLRGRIVELRPLREDDFEALYSTASDPRIWEQHPEPLRYQRAVFQKFFDGAMKSGGAFAVVSIQSGNIIGSSRYYDYYSQRREVVIGYTFLATEFWGRGYNHEMKTLMLDHAFRFVDRVLFQVGANNLRSQRALQKLGARVVGQDDLSALDGTLSPHFIFEITL